MNEAAAAIFLRPRARIAERSQMNQQMLYVQRINEQSAKQNLAENQQQRAILEAQYAKMADAPFLEASKRELHAQFEDMEKRISTKIQKDFGGDVNEYVNSIGQTDQMRNYKEFTTSDGYSRAVSSKASYVQWQDDTSKGKMARLGPDGHTMEHRYQMFNSGATNRLDYNGSYKPATKYVERLESKRGPNYFGTPEQNIVSQADIMTELTVELGNQRDALDQFLQSGLDRAKIYHKTVDPLDLAQFNQKKQHDYAMEAQGWARLRLENRKEDRQASEAKMANQQLDLRAFWGMNDNTRSDFSYNYAGAPAKVFQGGRPQMTGYALANDAMRKSVVNSTGGAGSWIEAKDRPDGTAIYQYAAPHPATTSDGTPIRVSGFVPQGITTVFKNGKTTIYARGVGYQNEREAEAAGVASKWSPTHNQKFGGSDVENVSDTWGSFFGSAAMDGNEKGKYKFGEVLIEMPDPNALNSFIMSKEGAPGIKTDNVINTATNRYNTEAYNQKVANQYNSLTGDQ